MKSRQTSRSARERDRLYHYAKGVGGSDQKDKPGQPPARNTVTTSDSPSASAHAEDDE